MARNLSKLEQDYVYLCKDMTLDLTRQLTTAFKLSLEEQAEECDRQIDRALHTAQAIEGYLLALKGFRNGT